MSDVKVTVTRDAYPGEVKLYEKLTAVIRNDDLVPSEKIDVLFQYIANNEHQKAAWPDDEDNPF